MTQTTTRTDWTPLAVRDAERLLRDAEEEGVAVSFLVPPAAQGQMVERAYAGIGGDGILCRTTDRSDGAVSYQIRDWRDADEDRPGANREPA